MILVYLLIIYVSPIIVLYVHVSLLYLVQLFYRLLQM